jgi:hypothetical protein
LALLIINRKSRFFRRHSAKRFFGLGDLTKIINGGAIIF